MDSKRYPIVLVCKETASPLEPYLEDQIVEKVVCNDTEYHSFLNQHSDDFGQDHNITERKASWKELKGHFFRKCYHWMPRWVIAVITYILGCFTPNLRDIWHIIKSLI